MSDQPCPTGAAKGVKRSSPPATDDQTETTTGDKTRRRAAGAGAANVIRRSAKFKRNCEFCLDLALEQDALTI
jgi:hypothetical protein